MLNLKASIDFTEKMTRTRNETRTICNNILSIIKNEKIGIQNLNLKINIQFQNLNSKFKFQIFIQN